MKRQEKEEMERRGGEGGDRYRAEESERCEARDPGKRRETGRVEREVRETESGVDALSERETERKRRPAIGRRKPPRRCGNK